MFLMRETFENMWANFYKSKVKHFQCHLNKITQKLLKNNRTIQAKQKVMQLFYKQGDLKWRPVIGSNETIKSFTKHKNIE